MESLYQVHLSSLILSISKIIDFVDPHLKNHQLRVALIAKYIAEAYGLEKEYINQIVLAGCFHDIAIFSLKERIQIIREEEFSDIHLHAKLGYNLLKDIPHFEKPALMIKYHHVFWEEHPFSKENEIPLGSYILHLADKIEIFLRQKKGDSIFWKDELIEFLKKLSGKVFMPDLVKAFQYVAQKTSFWLDMEYPNPEELVSFSLPHIILDLKALLKFSEVIRVIIDYRSRFTSIHSIGVAMLSRKLAELFHFGNLEKDLITIAGYLHDIGKLAVPVEILEKHGPLTKTEWWLMQSHAYYSYRILEKIDIKYISLWGALHHEKPNGKGYPFKLKDEDLSFGSKIVAVADIFTALVEDRPYRKGLDAKTTKKILKDLVLTNNIDSIVAEVVFKYFDEIYEYLKYIQAKEKEKYLEFEEKQIKKKKQVKKKL